MPLRILLEVLTRKNEGKVGLRIEKTWFTFIFYVLNMPKSILLEVLTRRNEGKVELCIEIDDHFCIDDHLCIDGHLCIDDHLCIDGRFCIDDAQSIHFEVRKSCERKV